MYISKNRYFISKIYSNICFLKTYVLNALRHIIKDFQRFQVVYYHIPFIK